MTTHLLSFDVESNGLHGEGFAFGAVILEIETAAPPVLFEGRCPIEGWVDPWVDAHVLPVLADMSETFVDSKTLRAAFWDFLQGAMARFDNLIVLADCAYPVETNFLRACQMDDLPNRAFKGPYPLHELATMLLAADVDPDVNRLIFAGLEGDERYKAHHPLTDALASARCYEIAIAILQGEGA